MGQDQWQDLVQPEQYALAADLARLLFFLLVHFTVMSLLPKFFLSWLHQEVSCEVSLTDSC